MGFDRQRLHDGRELRTGGMALYGASRAALELLTKAWAAEYGPSGVRVNAVAPGPTRTRMMEAVPDEMVKQLAALAPAGSRSSARGTCCGDRLPRQ
jgi:Dehydrogenases with different specificities (related to short-chain alcohol dehydrogenases)